MGGATGQITVHLSPSTEADPGAAPYSTADLTVDATAAPGDQVVRAVCLQDVDGGPRLVYSLTAPAGSKQTITVALPAVSQQQRYRVDLLAADAYPAPVLASLTAAVTWSPAQTDSAEAFFDSDCYEPWLEDPPTWPADLRRNVFVALVLTCLAAAGAGMIRSPAIRIAALIVIAAACTAGVAAYLSAQPVILEQTARDGDLIVLRCLRQTHWHSQREDLVPVYFDKRHMRRDNLVIHSGRGLRVRLSPTQDAHRVRIFRRRDRTTTRP